jgi:cysteine synthase
MDNWTWEIEHPEYWQRTVERCRHRKLLLPTFQQLKSPQTIPRHIQGQLKAIGMDELHPLNLFRIHWCNDPATGGIGGINFLELPSELTGTAARIVGLVGKHFPTGAHKVGATYGCLVPYLVSGRFDPDYHKAVWPSTGNYCRGGAFNSNLLSVHAVAILPEEMSPERFDWLRQMGAEIYATPGCESNVKEIYDKCHELEATSDQYLIFNQFEQFGNAVWHYEVTGAAIERLFEQIKGPGDRVQGFVSATGSAGTIAAGDYLRTKFPWIKVLAAEALQCPTLYLNGFGGHRIEGIGDKHIPWIHNIKNLDLVCAIDDQQPLLLLRLFNEPAGWEFLQQLGVARSLLPQLPWLGLSSICNLLSAIKLAKYFEWGRHDVIFTVFTDSVELYRSRLREMSASLGPYSLQQAAIDWHVIMKNQGIDFIKELGYYEKKSIHNLKYFTWVEQQGKDVAELNAQWSDESYWEQRLNIAAHWDRLIEKFNHEVGRAQ